MLPLLSWPRLWPSILCSIIVIGGVWGIMQPQHAYATDFTWHAQSDVSASAFRYVDVTPGILRDGNDIYMFYSNGGAWPNTSWNSWHVFKGTSMDNMVEQPRPVVKGFVNGAGAKTWIGGAWNAGSTWYAIAHVEFNYNSTPAFWFNWFRKTGILSSTDKGHTWTYLGDILTSPNSYNINDYYNLDYIATGDADPKLFVDATHGYLYIYYTSFWVEKSTAERFEGTRVARCPINASNFVTCWRKWYNDAWNEPGIGGKDSDVWQNEDGAPRSIAISRLDAARQVPRLFHRQPI
jgi:hypothetical protein